MYQIKIDTMCQACGGKGCICCTDGTTKTLTIHVPSLEDGDRVKVTLQSWRHADVGMAHEWCSTEPTTLGKMTR